VIAHWLAKILREDVDAKSLCALKIITHLGDGALAVNNIPLGYWCQKVFVP